MFYSAEKEISTTEKLIVNFTGSFLVITSIDLERGSPQHLQFRCGYFLLETLIANLNNFPQQGIEYIDTYGEAAIILQNRQSYKTLIAAGQVLEIYRVAELAGLLQEVLDKWNESE